MNSPNLIFYRYEFSPGNEEIRCYASARYYRWLDYSKYHSSLAGIEDEANDVLNEVLLALFSKDTKYTEKLYKTKKGQYRELDFFVLRMIKLNCHSVTSPYRNKYKNSVKINHDIDFSRINIADEEDDQIDKAGEILRQYRLVKFVADGLDLNEFERRIFEFRFIDGMSFSKWPGQKGRQQLYETFKMVLDCIHEILYSHGLTKVRPKPSGYSYSKNRKDELIERFEKTRKIHVN
ncbi:MAG: hypothetical protein JW731_14310 [Bacteroidales bacterium]|nr:hypothetical protein [Bacteroidales bacterium]